MTSVELIPFLLLSGLGLSATVIFPTENRRIASSGIPGLFPTPHSPTAPSTSFQISFAVSLLNRAFSGHAQHIKLSIRVWNDRFLKLGGRFSSKCCHPDSRKGQSEAEMGSVDIISFPAPRQFPAWTELTFSDGEMDARMTMSIMPFSRAPFYGQTTNLCPSRTVAVIVLLPAIFDRGTGIFKQIGY